MDSMTATKPKLALIIGSTRPSRFADKPVEWFRALAAERQDVSLEVLDLRDFDLPFFADLSSELYMPSGDPKVQHWQQTLAGYDGFIFVTAEYNHSITGALKNALDLAYKAWMRKPMGILAYGGTGGTRAAEHLRTIGVELHMVPVRNAVHIGGADMLKVHPFGQGADMAEIDANLRPSATALLDDMVWWARATMAARAEDLAQAA
jgi:NAD(P)H-dependent FMN reductase